MPITVNSRIGVDDMDSYGELVNFVVTVESAGCDNFVIHARKAWLKGLSHKENRSVPKFNYDWVYQIKRDFLHLAIVINGGIMYMESSLQHLEHVDGVMLGKAVYHQPYLLSEVYGLIYQQKPSILSRAQVVLAFSISIH